MDDLYLLQVEAEVLRHVGQPLQHLVLRHHRLHLALQRVVVVVLSLIKYDLPDLLDVVHPVLPVVLDLSQVLRHLLDVVPSFTTNLFPKSCNCLYSWFTRSCFSSSVSFSASFWLCRLSISSSSSN